MTELEIMLAKVTNLKQLNDVVKLCKAEWREFALTASIAEITDMRRSCYQLIMRRKYFNYTWNEYEYLRRMGSFWTDVEFTRVEEQERKDQAMKDLSTVRLKTVYQIKPSEDHALDAKGLDYQALLSKYEHMRTMAFRLGMVPELAKLWEDWADVLEQEIQTRLAASILNELKTQVIPARLPTKSIIPKALPDDPISNPRHR